MSRYTVVLGGVGTGLLFAAATPPWGWWPLALAGIAGLDMLIADQPRAVRFRRGLVVGLAMYLPTMWWMQDLTLPGYVIATVAYAALLGVAVGMVPSTAPGRWFALPGAIVVTELLRWSWPFGGVPLANLAIGQADGPLVAIVRIGGALLLVQLTVIAGLVLATALRRHWLASAVALGLVVLFLVVAAVAPRGQDVGEVDVALIQGGGEQGTRMRDTDQRDVFERHLRPSQDLEPPLDLVVWPENVVNVEGPVETNREGRELQALAQQLDVHLIVGVVEGIDSDNFANASVVYNHEGEMIDRYDKVHRVPFGEYVPLRWLIEPFAGDSLTSREALPGDGPPHLDTDVGRLSVAISWEIFFADRVREGVDDDAQLVLNPTNGASFTGTHVQTQQVAASKMRAIESDRWVLQVAPTGFSAVIGPDGTVYERSGISEPTVLRHTVALRSGSTIYTSLGLLPAWLAVLASLGMGWGWVANERRRRNDVETPPAASSNQQAMRSAPDRLADRQADDIVSIPAPPRVPGG